MNDVRNINMLHRSVCNGVISEMDNLIRKPIEQYGAIIDAYKYELHLRIKSTKE